MPSVYKATYVRASLYLTHIYCFIHVKKYHLALHSIRMSTGTYTQVYLKVIGNSNPATLLAMKVHRHGECGHFGNQAFIARFLAMNLHCQQFGSVQTAYNKENFNKLFPVIAKIGNEYCHWSGNDRLIAIEKVLLLSYCHWLGIATKGSTFIAFRETVYWGLSEGATTSIEDVHKIT